MRYRKLLFWGVIFCFGLLQNRLNATHIRAGEICAVRISQSELTYRFTLTIYTDLESDVPVTEGGDAIFRFGDGQNIEGASQLRERAVTFTREIFDDNIGVVTIEFIHTYAAPAPFYVVSYSEMNRNEGIINIPGSVDVPFHIQTVIRPDPAFFPNSSPKLTIAPIDRACVGKAFFHNPGAFDPDGDSLAYKLVTPQFAPGSDVNGFSVLNDPSITNIREDGGSPALFEIDPFTGTFSWDAPAVAGEYNIAFIVEEWRFSELTGRRELLGFLTRDMQIIVEDCENERPELTIPEDICVEAGTRIEEIILGLDPDNDPIKVEAFGGPFEVSRSPARFAPDPATFEPSPEDYSFTWDTDISHVQQSPYQVQFKISDRPPTDRGPSLVDFETWEITVVAPAPTGLNGALLNSRAIQLVWDDYIGADFAPVMQVYRRVDSFEFDPTDCNIGIPEGSGYVLIDELPIDENSYVDDNDIAPGVNYCYRLVAEFPSPRGGVSYASAEFCIDIPVDAPLITNVSVLETDTDLGEIEVRWTPPIEIDQGLFPPPYRYELRRFDGFGGGTGGTLLTSTNDTVFTDTNLNTRDRVYHYNVTVFNDASDDPIDVSESASSVRAEAFSLVDEIEITWSAQVPWTNQTADFPYHYIYRNRADAASQDEDNFVLIDSVNTSAMPFRYNDDGSFNGVPLNRDLEYCYFVTTQGSYGNPLVRSPLLNNSQEVCAQPGDETPPADPEIITQVTDTVTIDGVPRLIVDAAGCDQLDGQPCTFNNFSNTLNWEVNTTDDDVAGYRIYFSANGLEEEFELVGETITTSFTHDDLLSYKGCYRVTAFDRSNNESGASQTICFDNCPNYRLPNTFTPNADGVNDTFMAFDRPDGDCPRFVQDVEFQVFSRWGGSEIFSYSTCGAIEPDFFINWDGKDNNGNDLPSGTYYYTVTVTFDVLNPEKRTQEFRNWVKLIR